MDSEGERIKREIRAIEEVLAVRENRKETGDWQNITELHLKNCVPPEYHYFEELDSDALELRKKRLEEDLKGLSIPDEESSERDLELFSRRRIRDEEDGE